MTDTKNSEATAAVDETVEAKPAAPFMSVLKGNPTPQETATLAVLFAGMANSAAAEEDKGPHNNWGRLEEGFHQPKNYLPGQFLNVSFY